MVERRIDVIGYSFRCGRKLFVVVVRFERYEFGLILVGFNLNLHDFKRIRIALQFFEFLRKSVVGRYAVFVAVDRAAALSALRDEHTRREEIISDVSVVDIRKPLVRRHVGQYDVDQRQGIGISPGA